jgi:hypothetical protein
MYTAGDTEASGNPLNNTSSRTIPIEIGGIFVARHHLLSIPSILVKDIKQ